MKQLGLALGALLAVVAVLPATPASAGQDRIAFSCADYLDPYSDLADICVLDPDSDAPATNITNTSGGGEDYPSYSPDGSQIAFSGDYGGLNDLFVTPATPSGTAVNVSDSPACQEWYPAASWSPDGGKLAYQARLCSSAPQDRAYVAPAAGDADPVKLGPEAEPGGDPQWSPDGSKIAYESSGGIAIVSSGALASRTVLPGTGANFDPQWSPDGSRLLTVQAISGNYTLQVLKADGSGSPIDLVSYDTILSGPQYAWSPDGKRVAWAKNDGVIHINSASDPSDGHDLPAGALNSQNLSFSPDGSRVAFDAYPDPVPTPTLRVVYTQKIDGSAPPVAISDPTVNAEEPDWMPRDTPIKPPNPPGTKKPKTVIFANIIRYPVAGPNPYVLVAGVDCHAQGGVGTNPYCQYNGEARYPHGATSGRRSLAGAAASRKKMTLVARGSVRVPVGKKKPLKLRITKAGRKLINRGHNLKVKLTIKLSRKGMRSSRKTRTVTIKVKKHPKKRH